MKQHRATMIIVLGILGIAFCAPFGVVAFFMGRIDLKEMSQGMMDPSGRDQTKLGMIIGGISGVFLLLLCVLAILGVIAALVIPMLNDV